MNDEIQSHKKCYNQGYVWRDGRYHEDEPICYSFGLRKLVSESSPGEPLHSLEIIDLCAHSSAVRVDDIGYCAACEFFHKKIKQVAPEQEVREALFS